MTESFIIWTESGTNTFSVDQFTGVPVVTPGAIVIVHPPADGARTRAEDPRNELRETLLTSGPGAKVASGGIVTAPDPTADALFAANRRKLLVLKLLPMKSRPG